MVLVLALTDGKASFNVGHLPISLEPIGIKGGWDGLPDHGEYARLLRSAKHPSELLERIQQPGFHEHDQWQVQVQALIQAKAQVHVHAGGLSDEQIREALLLPCRDIEATLAELMERYAPDASVCVLPEGPQTVPHVRKHEK